jgi:hypothetical protein
MLDQPPVADGGSLPGREGELGGEEEDVQDCSIRGAQSRIVP